MKQFVGTSFNSAFVQIREKVNKCNTVSIWHMKFRLENVDLLTSVFCKKSMVLACM